MKRVLIVADSSLIVQAISIGFRESREFKVVGYADGRRSSARVLPSAGVDLVLLDDMGESEHTIELIGQLRKEDERLTIIVLSLGTDPAWVEQAFEAGATALISKTTHPSALVTLVREVLNGHIFVPCSGAAGTAAREARTIGPPDAPLTAREAEILKLVAAGSTNGEVARVLWVTEQTVKFHLRNIYRKLHVANRTQASRFVYANRLVETGDRAAELAELTAAS
jgi:DNA-binding NarL/FixJ family response regulator